MGKRSRFELERREMLFFKGDWARLGEILAPKKISPTEFIRELVHKKLRQIDDRASQTHKTLETVDVNTDGLAISTSLPDESGGIV